MTKEEAINIVKINWPDSSYKRLQEALETLIPELKESEDERIRGAIIDHLKDNNLTEWADWLEKQGNLVKYYEDKLDRCACDNFNKGYKKALEKQDAQAIKEALRTEYEKGRADAIVEMQNHEWTEEDERKLELIKSLIDDVKGDSASYSTIFREMDELNNWVESFKNKVQSKQEL